MFRPTALLFLLTLIVGCAADASGEPFESTSDKLVSSKVDDHWFYGGALLELADPSIVVSIAGHTARVTGYLPVGTEVPSLPHVMARPEDGRLRLDIVYPIATARPEKRNSRPGTYSFYQAKPYRPNGATFTNSDGWHDVPWGGFPFLGYNDGIAFHGPITDKDNEASNDLNVWYLRRGTVSGGCNRMMGEHVVELAHILGISMRKVYGPNTAYRPTTSAKTTVIADYDTLDGKFIDVDYPTDTGATRPGTVHGVENVVMFGSWVATELPNGEDLPPAMKWEGGVRGELYDFPAHAIQGVVCSMPKSSLSALGSIAAAGARSELPADFCAKKVACDARLGRTCKPLEIGL